MTRKRDLKCRKDKSSKRKPINNEGNKAMRKGRRNKERIKRAWLPKERDTRKPSQTRHGLIAIGILCIHHLTCEKRPRFGGGTCTKKG